MAQCGNAAVRGGVRAGVAAAAAAAGPHHRPAHRRCAGTVPCGAAVFRQSGAGGRAVLGAGDAAGDLRSENDPRPALRDVRQADADMLEDTPIPLGIWLKDHKFTMQDYQSWTKYEMNSGDALLGNGGKQGRTHEIQCFIKDAYGMPYIPGSSIKGMIRSALLAYEVKKNPKKYENIKQDILSNIGNKASRTKFLQKEDLELETMVFHTLNREGQKRENAVNSIMAGIIVGDSLPIDPKRLTLSQKIDYTLSKTERTFPLLRETIMPETRVLFELTIDTQICQYKIEDIKAALELFNEICYERFYSHFGRGDNRKGIVWIGGGVGYLSKTVIYSLFDREAVQVALGIFKGTLSEKIFRQHKHDKDRSLGVSPHVCKCTRYNNQLYDMGKCQLRVLKKE